MNDVYFSEIDSLVATWHSFIKVLIQLFSGISYDNAFASCMQLMIYMTPSGPTQVGWSGPVNY